MRKIPPIYASMVCRRLPHSLPVAWVPSMTRPTAPLQRSAEKQIIYETRREKDTERVHNRRWHKTSAKECFSSPCSPVSLEAQTCKPSSLKPRSHKHVGSLARQRHGSSEAAHCTSRMARQTSLGVPGLQEEFEDVCTVSGGQGRGWTAFWG